MASGDTAGLASSPPTENGGEPRRSDVISNGVKILGEAVLPGASELLEKRVAKGAVFAGVGLGAPPLMVALLGPVAGGIVGGALAIGTRVVSYWDSMPERTEGLFDRFERSRTPLQILEERYARSEINTTEYQERRRALESPTPESKPGKP